MMERDALEAALGDALRPARAPEPGDAELLRRLVDRVVAAPPAPRPSLRLRLLGAGGVGLAVGAAVLAGLLHRAPPPARPVETRVTPVTTASPPPATAPATTARAATPDTDLLPAPTAPAVTPSAPREAMPTAAELFARANGARRQGRDPEAVAGYRALQRAFPSSPEAVASHMSLGRLLLDDRSDPAGALAQFDRYLASGSHRELREEALIGRALALGQLARSKEERQAWKALLQEYPGSMYADQARDRVAALGG